MDGHAVSSKGTLEQGPSGLIYTDVQERFSITLPEDWSPLSSQHSLALFHGDGASILIQEQYAAYPVANLLTQTRDGIRKNHPDATTNGCSVSLGGDTASCFEISYLNENKTLIHQRIIAVRRRLKIFIFIESWHAPDRPPVLDRIEENLHFM